MFMPQTAPKRWTAAMARRLLPDDGNRYEIIDGRLHVTPAPGWPHQTIGGRLHGQLWPYLRQFGLSDTVLFSPADISWDRHTLVQPDLFVVRPDEVTGKWRSIQHLLLAVEVISPSSRRRDMVVKRALYQKNGVAEYWVVDAQARSIQVWRPDDRDATVVTETLTWRPASVPKNAAAFVLDVKALFQKLPA
jgi:Uma2 family endonuclease